MRHLLLIAAVCLSLTSIGACEGEPKKAIGEACVVDVECDNGFCLDLAVLDSSCRGRVCTRGCQGDSDCPAAAEGPDCRRFGGRSLCFYEEWRRRRCQ